ncbi:MAG: ABC transporter ATP-binding protein [Kiloniellales bacterium]
MVEGDRTGGMDTILKLEDLQVHFPIGESGLFKRRTGALRAVDGVDLEIRRGETLGLVGESGSGKTTLGRALLRAIEPTAGRILYDLGGERGDLRALGRRALRQQWRRMQMVFQDPYSSLNPRMTVRDVIAEPLVANRLARGKALDRQVREIAGLCGLRADHLGRFPHAFSGGQRQRIAIARALVLRPLFIVCDEPVSALDVSIQAQILNLLKELQQELSLTYLFIAHDLAAVAYASDRVAVMYLGQIVELAPTEQLYYGPRHPYTEALMSAIPAADPDERMAPVLLQGERPSPANPPNGCRFHTRCRYAQARCSSEAPALREIATGHLSACHFAETLTLKGARELTDSAAAPAAPPRAGQTVKNTTIGEKSR